MPLQSTQYLVESIGDAGGGNDRLSTGPRTRTLVSGEFTGPTMNLAAGNATTVILWERAQSAVQDPTGVTLLLDPGPEDGTGDYEDNDSDPVLVVVQITVADTSDFTSNPISQFHEFRRERVISFPGKFRSALTASSNDKSLILIQARNKHSTDAVRVRIRITE